MKKIFILLLALPLIADAQSKDLKTEINQSAFDKILTSMDIPLVLFEHNSPFPKNLAAFDPTSKFDEFDKVYGYDEMQSLFSWGVNGEATRMADVNDLELKKELKNQWLTSMEEVNEVIDNYDYAVKKQTEPGYTGPLPSDFEGGDISIAKLKTWQKADVKTILTDLSKMAVTSKLDFVRAHLSYAKAELYDRPTLTVNSPNFKAANIKVKVSATGELWMKVPRFKCCRHIGPICVWVCIDRWEWIKIASVSPSVKIGSDVSITFEIQQLKIFAGGLFDKLFLDYFILRDINLAGIGNIYLRNKKFELYDVSKFVASLPYINKKFRIQDIKLPPRSGGVTVEIDITNQ
ncbi:MAG TPA: hypothetical protein VGQ04_22285 [Chitinophagaceae bacterium]|jgi:hypothetical protein|nr:hypothetical protein [Chitinophagaceae bacterium]